ncbi:CUB and sushi domain-containing protein 3-like [Lytechinus variegatus]|uniref:CUB and sushi domain-containing protein 3-like n=1 Tax=Lytechinus variegatus TaxID=7654 RepID=UPI001BB2BB43|nr:CUB and sushi domain-containing protein 3-like [Lytechinus variegatus]
MALSFNLGKSKGWEIQKMTETGQGYGDYTYLGCFYDNSRREPLPDLIYCERNTYPYDTCQNACGPQAQFCQSQEMTIELCRDICADQNMRYFGLQTGAQCLCGGFFAPYNVLGQPDGDDTCNRPCSGNSRQLCGSDFQVRVYQINESPSDCFNPGYVLNGDQSQQDSYLYNASDVIDFANVCPPPSIKDGAASITCTASGNWTNPPPTCTVGCATPTAPMHASFSSWQTLNDNYAVYDEVFFDCDINPSRTNQTLTCGYYGDWETYVPDCPGISTCQGYCETQATGGCFCDYMCQELNDCCEDYYIYCQPGEYSPYVVASCRGPGGCSPSEARNFLIRFEN